MTKTPEQIKNIVEDWIKITNAKIEDITESEKKKQPKINWILKINNVLAVYMIEGRPDRLALDVPIAFAKEHQEATTKLSDKEFLQFLIDIVEPVAIAGITANPKLNQKQIEQINLQTYLDTESLEREKFFKLWDQITTFREVVIKKVQIKFGVQGMSDTSTTSSAGSMYG